MGDFVISQPGAYPGISDADYHGREICDGPSISSSGVKLISRKSPRHYWHQSPLNPARPARQSRPHFSVGRALHYVVLPGGAFEQQFHVLPQGFDAGHSSKFAEAIDARNHAIRKGRDVLTWAQHEMVLGMADSILRHELAGALLSAGTPEMTLAARDPQTGVWLRAKPDLLPDTTEIIPDVKTAMDASLTVYEAAATRFGYYQSAAFYLDVIEAIYGPAKRQFVLITVEKEPPYEVVLDHLDDVDIDMARLKNRAAINKFADCLRTGNWYGYNEPGRPIRSLVMSNFERAMINQMIERGELSYD